MTVTAPHEQHPAWRAWQRLGVGAKAIEIATHLESQNKMRSIYRVLCADGTRIVAKLARTEVLKHERAVYEQVLPLLPVPTPYYFGSVAEDTECGWIFLEDVGGKRLSPLDPEHRRLAAAWLGDAHSAAADAVLGVALADAGQARYLEHLRAGRRGILCNFDNPAFDASHRAVLDSVLRCCDRLEAAWSDVGGFSDSLPSTFVHGDFRPKNVHVRDRHAQLSVVAMDWETSGWGPCAADLAPWHADPRKPVVDLAVYADHVRECWPGLRRRTLERAVKLGQVFRQLAGIDWAVPSLPYPWPEKPIGWLRVHSEVLEDALRKPAWLA